MITAEELTTQRGGRAIASGVTFRGEAGTITGELVLEAGTVKKHVVNVLSTLDLSSRAQAVAYGYEHGLTRPGG